MTFHLNVFLNVFSSYHHVKKLLCIEYKNTVYSCMCPHMTFQISMLFKELWALITWIWLFTCMYSQMLSQNSFLCKDHWALITWVLLFTYMYSQMRLQMIIFWERFWALIGRIWVFFCVVFLCAYSNFHFLKKPCCTIYKGKVFHLYVFSNVFSN